MTVQEGKVRLSNSFGTGSHVVLLIITLGIIGGTQTNAGGDAQRSLSLSAGMGRTVTAVHSSMGENRSIAAGTTSPHPRARLGGYSPLVVVKTSDERKDVLVDFCHEIEPTYVGSPLETTLDRDFAFAVYDTGADFNLFSGDSALELGLFGDQLTPFEYELWGIGLGEAAVSQPLGVFAAGLYAIHADGQPNENDFVGHSNVSVFSAPQILCGEQELLTGVVGMPFISFFNTIFRVDVRRSATIAGITRSSPEVIIQDQSVPLPVPAHKLLLEFAGPVEPVLTACYNPHIDFKDTDLLGVPDLVTMLSQGGFSGPSGANLMTTIHARMGELGPANPDLSMRMILDTGAQVSLITPAALIKLNLPLTPDFQVTVCGVGGSREMDGYYVDYIKMNAQGGALEFSRAPFLVLDIPSPDGGAIDGLVGTNFFWNRNLTLQPSPTGTSYLHLSEPVLEDADYDADTDVDLEDVAFYMNCLAEPANPICVHLDSNANGTIDLDEFAEVAHYFCAADSPDPWCAE